MHRTRLPYITGSCLQRDGTETNYRLFGNGGELVVFIPGFSCGMEMWTCAIENIAISGRFSFLCLENIEGGFGSGRCCLSFRFFSKEGYYSTVAMATDLWNVVTELGWRQVHLIGFSMGGMIVSKAASMYPERVLSLTLLSTPKYGVHIVLPSWRTLRIVTRVIPRYLFFQLCPLCQRRGCKEMNSHTRIFFETYLKYSEHYLLELIASTEDNSSLLPRWRYIEQQQQSEKHSLPCYISTLGQLRAIICHYLSRDEIATIRQASFPVLCIFGKYDQLVSEKRCRSFARELNSRYVVLPGAHFITEECAEQVNQLIRLFLEQKSTLQNQITPLYFV